MRSAGSLLKSISLFFLVSVLAYAGVVHLISPKIFLIVFPNWVPLKIPIIYVTGFLEIILAIGLLYKKTRSLSAMAGAIYFLLILPVHVYMAIYHVPLGPVKDPLFLWARVGLQFVLIAWAWSFKKRP